MKARRQEPVLVEWRNQRRASLAVHEAITAHRAFKRILRNKSSESQTETSGPAVPPEARH